MHTETAENVNPHYLSHLLAVAHAHEVVVTEDIVAANGIPLLIKGTRIDGVALDRLLLHQLRKPLEDCVQVVGGLQASAFAPMGRALLEDHPLLRALCTPGAARPAPESLATLTLTLPMQSMLTVYTQGRHDRLAHVVGVAMLALSLARRLLPGEVDRHRVLAIAGLFHDVGELYIDPAYLQRGIPLDDTQWQQFLQHPLVGYRMLRNMPGAGQAVANVVLLHHERLDGFGYPRSVSGSAFKLDGQILAAAEWLMAIVESDPAPLTRARMADRLVPGEFSPPVLAAIAALAQAAPDTLVELASAPPLLEAAPRIVRLAEKMRHFREARGWIDAQLAEATPPVRQMLEAGLQRMLRIQSSFSSIGLDAFNPEQLLADLATLHDAGVYMEVMSMVGELEWRLRELARKQKAYAYLLPQQERALVNDLAARLRWSPQAEEAAVTA
ncbi:MAG: HD domain-containing phosphohydrolase [Pseudomonadota bacterium]